MINEPASVVNSAVTPFRSFGKPILFNGHFSANLLTNLPAFSPLNFYLPQAILSPTPHSERYQRFYSTLGFYGFNDNQLGYFLDQMLYNNRDLPYQKDYNGINMALFDLVLFYGRFSHSKRTESEKNQMINEYKRMLGTPFKFDYKADYIIISKFDEPLINSNSPAEKIVKNKQPLFQNEKYKVFKI